MGASRMVHRVIKGLIFGDFWGSVCNHFIERMIFWIAVYVMFILGDEYIKEHYLFDERDVYDPWITHEKLLVYGVFILLIFYGVLGILCVLHHHFG